jgi:thiamine-phosphate pyrophosphorylase
VSDSLGRRALARAAARLNLQGVAAGALPPLCLMTDDRRLEDPVAAALALPRGSLVVARAREAEARTSLVSALKAAARARDLILLVAADPALAARSGADGVHLPEKRAGEIAHWRAAHPGWLITVAAHSLAALARCRGADAVFLAPIFATGSHPGRSSLNAVRANAIAKSSPTPVYALGGVDAQNASRLSGENYAGLAAISALAVLTRENRDAGNRHRR